MYRLLISSAVACGIVLSDVGPSFADEIDCPPNIIRKTVDNVFVDGTCRIRLSTVEGNIVVTENGNLLVQGSLIKGSVQAEGASRVRLLPDRLTGEETVVIGDVQIENTVADGPASSPRRWSAVPSNSKTTPPPPNCSVTRSAAMSRCSRTPRLSAFATTPSTAICSARRTRRDRGTAVAVWSAAPPRISAPTSTTDTPVIEPSAGRPEETPGVAAGEGRTSRMLIERGASSVLGADISPEMVRRANEPHALIGANPQSAKASTWPGLRYTVLDARDDTFQLASPVDVVTAMYLFHYAPSEDDLERMARLIARNLKPGGRFVTYTLSPDYDFSRAEPLLMERCGFDYAVVGGPHCELIIGGDRVDIWQWSRDVHETRLRRAGLTDVRWHPPQAPPDAPEVEAAVGFYLANPTCIVLSATLSQDRDATR